MNQAPPLIIPRAEHPISRRLLSHNAVKVLYRLRDNGFTAYLVGGSVRDLLLGREPKDFDIVTDATPPQIKKIFRNCRLVGRRFRLAHLHFQNEIIEVATFRSAVQDDCTGEGMVEGEAAGAEQPSLPRLLKTAEGLVLCDNIFGTPEEDAIRRDFTVNALCYDITDFSIIDHVGGINDLKQGIIRTIGDPMVRFVEDPVRMLRAVRFAAMLGFTIEERTWQAILQLSSTITKSSPPRLYEEILKLFLLGAAERTYQLMRQSGLFTALFPHFSQWLDRESDDFPHTWIGTALSRVDMLLRERKEIPPQLLLTLMFGQYLQEKVADLRQRDVPAHQAVQMAVAELMGEVAPTVQFTNRVAILMRDILTGQLRLQKIPGRRPDLFAGRRGFNEALEYFRFAAEITGENKKAVGWWEKFLQEQQSQSPATAEHSPEQVRKRRRRRRRKPRRSSPAQDT